jgi:hypothetical protein
VNLVKTPAPAPSAPPVTKAPNFAAAGTQSPVPQASQSFLTGNKTLTMSPPNAGKTPNFAPANVAKIGVNKPAALPAPVSFAKPTALPAPKPQPVRLALPAPKPAPQAPKYDYRPVKQQSYAVAYKSSSTSAIRK